MINKVKSSITSAYNRMTKEVARGQERSTRSIKDHTNQWADIIAEWRKVNEERNREREKEHRAEMGKERRDLWERSKEMHIEAMAGAHLYWYML